MKTIRTFADRRPDLVEIQIQAARKLCSEDYRHVVASTVEVEQFKDGEFHIQKELQRICAKYGAEYIWQGGKPIQAALDSFFGDTDDWTLFLEEDVIPCKAFSIERSRPAARFHGEQMINKTVQAWTEIRLPETREFWDVIPLRRVWTLDELPEYLPQTAKDFYAAGFPLGLPRVEYGYGFEIMGEADEFVHLDKCGGVTEAWFLRGKDYVAGAICDWLGINRPRMSFARIADVQTPVERERHEAAVRRAERGKINPFDCEHIGKEVERVKCQTCSGKQLIVVYQCSINGKCSPKTDVGFQVCEACDDFVDKNK